MKVKKTYKWITMMDTDLEERIQQLGLTETQNNHCRNLIRIIDKNDKGSGWVPLPKNYLSKVFGGNRYREFLKPMIEKEILSVNNSYSNLKNYSKKYKINRKTNFDDYSTKIIDNKLIENNKTNKSKTNPLVTLCVHHVSQALDFTEVKELFKEVEVKYKKERIFIKEENDFTDQIKSIEFDKKALELEIEKRVNGVNENDFKVNNEIGLDVIRYPFDKDNGEPLYLKKQDAIYKAIGSGYDLIQDDAGRIYVTTIYAAINKKKCEIYKSYTEAVNNILEGNYYHGRNDTNNRLDTNFTNMASVLIEVIKKDNDIVEIDMTNSQFAILTYVMPDLGTEDCEYFKKICVDGTLYTNLQEKLSLNSRKEAKTVCFEVLFSDWRNRSKYVTKMREMFPSVMEYVDTFKKENGSNQFSISLQKKEAEIFIDNLYPKVRKRKLFCLTKHDSLIVRREDEAEVRQIIKEYFDEIGFKAHLKN